MTTWLSDASANRHIKTYVKDFLDLSGNMTVRQTDDYAWNNYGQIISGVYESDDTVRFGCAVAVDISGLTIVVGAPDQDGADTSETSDGAVTVYRYDTSAEIWYQLGNIITGETTQSDFGYNVDINDAGNRVMVTCPSEGNFINIYDYNSSNNTWDKQASITPDNITAFRATMSGDGNTIVYRDNDTDEQIFVYRNTSGTTWTKIGEFTGSVSSTRPALSYDGNRVTVPEYSYDLDADGNAAADIGRVTIYDYSGSGTTWNQVGNPIYGRTADDALGVCTDMSTDGSIVAISSSASHYAVVYQYDASVDGSWNQLGTTIYGTTDDYYGNTVRISGDGTSIVITDWGDNTVGTDAGAAYIYKYINGDWVQRGSTWYPPYSSNFTYAHGTSICFNYDGSKIFAGGWRGSVNVSDSGFVQALQWSQKYNSQPALDISGGTMTMWGGAEHVVANYSVTQLGSTLSGASSGIAFGKSMDMDSTGTIWAIGDNYNTTYGSVSVYKYQNGLWSQLGSTLYGTNSSDYLGYDISISGDGKVLILSAIASGGFYTSGGTRVYGYVNTYRYTNGDWVLFGETSGYNTSVSIVPTNDHASSSYWGSLISTNNDGSVVALNEMNGSAKGGIWRYDSSSDSWSNEHLFGHAATDVAMSRDGTRVVTGHEGGDTNVTNDGAIRVYDYNSSTQTWSQVGSTITGHETWDRTGYRVAISGDGNTFFQCASNESSDGNSYGQVYTYVQDASGGDGDWVQKGPDFVGDTTIRYGRGSSLDYDGDTLILGAPNVDVTKVYKYLDGYWQQIGDDIDFDGSTGESTAINDAGTIFAVGASGTTNGTAVAYNLNNNPALKIEDGNAQAYNLTVIGQDSENGKVGGLTVEVPDVDNEGYAYLKLVGKRTLGTYKRREGYIGAGADGGNYGNQMIFKLKDSGVEDLTWDEASEVMRLTTGEVNIGLNSSVGTEAVALGLSANAYHDSQAKQVAVGAYANATGQQGIALGGHANAVGVQSIALGYAANASAANSIALGRSALATDIYTSAFGYVSSASEDYATAIGSSSNAYSGQSTALGFTAKAGGYRSVAIGAYANTTADNTIVLGITTHAVTVGYNSHQGKFAVIDQQSGSDNRYHMIFDKDYAGMFIARGNSDWGSNKGRLKTSFDSGSSELKFENSSYNYWLLRNLYSNHHFYFLYNGSERGYLVPGSNVAQIDFTGQHRGFVENIHISEGEQYEGLIVCANKNEYFDVDDTLKRGIDAIQISQSLPYTSLCTKENDKTCYGVISLTEDEDSRTYEQGTFGTKIDKQHGDNRFYINSLGEGAIWICNKNGSLESGDYITSASVPGYGQLQNDDILHNYTVAKITMDCDFAPPLETKKQIKREQIDFFQDISGDYWFDASGNAYHNPGANYFEDASGNRVFYDRKGKSIYTFDNTRNENPVIYDLSQNQLQYAPTNYYHSTTLELLYGFKLENKEDGTYGLPYSMVYKNPAYNLTFDESNNLIDVTKNILDEHKELQWEDTEEQVRKYKIRYIDATGTVLTEEQYNTKNAAGEDVYIAAFVGCTYHCG